MEQPLTGRNKVDASIERFKKHETAVDRRYAADETTIEKAYKSYQRIIEEEYRA